MGRVVYLTSKGAQASKNTSIDNKTRYSELGKLKQAPYAKKKYMKPGEIYERKNTKDLYELTYNTEHVNSFIKEIHKNLNIIDEPETTPISIWNTTTTKYNRFKIQTLNDKLQRGFAHVFFVRPNCNIASNNASSLNDSVKNNTVFEYAMKQSPSLIKELVLDNGKSHQFMMSLSNHIVSFSPNDEVLETSVYGTTYTGYKIAYGKNNIESRTANTLSLSFQDDKQMHIYQLHKLWTEYISGVYRGEILPRTADVIDKRLDYASAIYYFILAEDNETILYWTKYYGVFPSTVPTDQFAWAQGNMIKNADEISVTYNYSMKARDMDPMVITEFNKNANAGNISLNYVPTYDEELHAIGPTWVGCPFVEQTKNGSQYFYKLRFNRG